jgi:putative peptide maturation dehydrogenase
VAVSVLRGEEFPIARPEADVLLAIPADRWVRGDTAGDPELVRRLAEYGLLVTDGPDGQLAELRSRDERLMSPPWNRYAALFHSLTRWRDVKVALAEPPSPSSPPRRVRWRPPHHFHAAPKALAVRELPLAERTGPLYDLLAARKTSRGFVEDSSLTLDELSIVLKTVWGCRGLLWLGPDLTILKKTSPSGGSQHPIEVYPLVRAVDGLDPGLYHYGVERHELELVERLAGDEAAELITEVTAGQPHFARAQAVFLMAARFGRNHWKYAAHAKAFRVMLMDAAHLSQTLYLVCTELGLGAFVTAAINEENIDRRLGLDAFGEGAVLVCGCGRPAPSEREPAFAPYRPREDPS